MHRSSPGVRENREGFSSEASRSPDSTPATPLPRAPTNLSPQFSEAAEGIWRLGVFRVHSASRAATIGAMRVLYHLTLSPFARKVRVALAEKNLEFTLKLEKVWERRPEFLALNPAGEVPVLIEPDGTVLAGTEAIVEYLDEAYREKILIGINPIDRAEVRRLNAWFDIKMNAEVTENLLGEKMMRRLEGHGQPNSQAIRAGHANLPHHLDYIGYLVERRRWLAGDHFSTADIAAAAHLSSLDYLGDVPWEAHEAAKDWYARIKSRPSFRQILADHVAGAPPPKHYPDLDF
jgi:glutathione S-transferase